MNIGKIIKSVFGSSAAKTVAATATSALTQAVAATAKAGNPIGDAAIATATALETSGKSGADKKAAVVAAIAPLVLQSATKGGLAALAVDAETFAGLVVEEVVAGMKATPLGLLASALLAAFGIKLSA